MEWCFYSNYFQLGLTLSILDSIGPDPIDINSKVKIFLC